ncbi:MAG: hypothetical protein J0M11_03750 [Anaerolineae bacterium]|nr:hypothetical protein [Anaerolineae bacterium]
MATVQVFATVNEIHEGSELRGSEKEFRVFEKLLAASQLLTMRVGHFLPVLETRTLNAPKTSTKLFLPFSLLSLTSIVNDGTTLSGSDYLLKPDGGHWANGPYTYLEIDPDATNLSAWDTDADGIVITGRLGLFNATLALGATLGAALSDTTGTLLQVSNGAKVSPGAVLLVDSEWLFVRETTTPVTAVTTLGAALDANAETCTVASGAALNVGEIIRFDFEQAKVIDINSNSVYLQRGWNKTTKTSHLINANVDVYRKFTIDRGVNGSTAATHTQGTAISRQQIPADVNELTRKIAVRMLKDAATGYAGRTGDEATGTAMYTYILPHELDEVMNQYRIARAA